MIFPLSRLLFLGYLYLLIPFLIFVLGWVKLIYALPVVLILIYLAFLLYRDSLSYKDSLSISPKSFWICITTLMSWMFILGVFGVFQHSWDMIGRNAMFRDLIEFSWPVIYPTNGAVVYYHGHWLVPALLGKIFGYTVGQIAFALWSLLGVSITLLLLFDYLKIDSLKKQLITLLVFMFFSGIFWNGGRPFLKQGVELCIISHTTQIHYLINQAIPVWVMAILFLHQKSLRLFTFLGLVTVLSSPYAIIGIFPFMLIKVYQKFKETNLSQTVTEIFSAPNILGVLGIAPILVTYFISNSTTDDGFSLMLNSKTFILFFIMLFQGVLAYLIVIYPKFKKDPIFWGIGIVMTILSVIKYSDDQNFSRSLNAALFIAMVYVLKFLWDPHPSYKLRQRILTVMLIIGCSIGSIWFFTIAARFIINGPYAMEYSDYRDTKYNRQWSNKNYQDTPFFKYLAK
ncbi:MAG: hypothetical protein ACRCVW_06065 [Brevinema sp.]